MIRIDAFPIDAPCCIKLTAVIGPWVTPDYEVEDHIPGFATGASLLVQSDYDHPSIASSMGWSPCDCGETDGTVDCPHRTASEMITEASQYLDHRDGTFFTDVDLEEIVRAGGVY